MVYDYLYSLSLLFYYPFDILDSEPLEKSSLSFRSPRGSSSPIHPTLSGKNESRYSSPIQSTLSEVSPVSHLSKDCNDSASCHDSSNPSNYHFNSPDVTDETSISTSCLEEHCLEIIPICLNHFTWIATFLSVEQYVRSCIFVWLLDCLTLLLGNC